MLDAVIKLSQRREPRLSLKTEDSEMHADVVMIDGTVNSAMEWARVTPWLKSKAVIWVDAACASGYAANRPLQWSLLPMMLVHALDQMAAVQRPQENASVPTLKSSILVVDDSVAVRKQLRTMLESKGHQVTEADSAELAIELASLRHFSCILMDVIMPGMSGYDACRQIKATVKKIGNPARNVRAAPVVMLTSRTSPFDRIKGKMAGCDAYLTKPIDADQLHETLAQYIKFRNSTK